MIRLATRDDWASIRALLLATPMSASLPLVVSRAEDPELAYPRPGAEGIALVSVGGDGAIDGYLHGAIESRRIMRGNSLVPERVMYLGDLRIAASARWTGRAKALLAAIRDHGRERGLSAGFCLVNDGNNAIVDLVTGGALGHRGAVLRTFTTAARLLVRRPRAAEGLEEYRPDSGDFAAMLNAGAGRFLSAALEPAQLAEHVARYPEMRFFRRAGERAPLFALWNPRRARALQLSTLPLALRVARAGWNLAGGHRFPSAGEAWQSATVTLATREGLRPGDDDAMASLAFEMGCHTLEHVESGLERESPLRLTGPCVRMKTHLVTLAIDDRDLPVCPPQMPVEVDLGFL